MSQRFEELCSKYMDEVISHEEEAELLGYLEEPEHEERFVELTRLNDEISGLLSVPVADDKMAELVMHEVTRRSGKVTAACAAIVDTIVKESSFSVTRLRSNRTPMQKTLSTPAGALGLSICLHAAMVVLILSFFHSAAYNHPTREVSAKKPARDTRTVARLEKITGSVFTNEDNGKVQASTGVMLRDGQDFETVGLKSSAQLAFQDGTEVIIGSDTRISRLSDGNDAVEDSDRGKTILLEHGVLRARVSKQPKDHPMVVVTGNAEAIVVGTKFLLYSSDGMTRLDVSEGVVRLRRLSDGQSVQVKAGEFAVVAPGVQLAARAIPSGPSMAFVKGVNLKGKPVVIDGNKWLSHTEALQDGLEVKFVPTTFDATSTKIVPIPPVDVETSNMLNSRLYSWQDDMVLTQAIANGDYEVYLWGFEPSKPYSRSFDILIQGKRVQSAAGRLKMGEWHKYGPYRANVKDGMLKIHLKRVEGTAALSGFAIFQRTIEQ